MQDITKYTIKTSTLKRKSSNQSLPDQNNKKLFCIDQKVPLETGKASTPSLSASTDTYDKDATQTPEINPHMADSRKISEKAIIDIPESNHYGTLSSSNSELQNVLGPLITEFRQEFKLLCETVDTKCSNLKAAIETQRSEVACEHSKMEKSLHVHKQDLTNKLDTTVNVTNSKMDQIIRENRKLRCENNKLLEKIQKIESQQLSNNVIISGISEGPWENYDMMKQRVHDTVAASMGDAGDIACQEQAKKVEITCCRCVDRFRPNHNQPIAITFQKKEDKEMLLGSKKKLPAGIYVNEDFLPDVKTARDRLRPIYRYVKGNQAYRDKCRMENDKLVINNIRYSLDDLHRLPQGLEAYKAAEKSSEAYIAFQGEHSPYSNFHQSPFKLDGRVFESAEQWIQYQKSILFHDTQTVEQIMQ